MQLIICNLDKQRPRKRDAYYKAIGEHDVWLCLAGRMIMAEFTYCFKQLFLCYEVQSPEAVRNFFCTSALVALCGKMNAPQEKGGGKEAMFIKALLLSS